MELPGIDDFECDKACGPDALEIWELQGFELEPEAELAANHINARIFQVVGAWAARQEAEST